MDKTDDRKLGLWPVVAIGAGGMVGGGIFAVRAWLCRWRMEAPR
ncbi:MAG: hypothetical protein WC617_09910 [Rhodanobacter sp.]|jgi:amino acid transporter